MTIEVIATSSMARGRVITVAEGRVLPFTYRPVGRRERVCRGAPVSIRERLQRVEHGVPFGG